MERIVIINESTFTKWMERVKELLSVLHCQEQQVKNKGIGTWLDTSEVCATDGHKHYSPEIERK